MIRESKIFFFLSFAMGDKRLLSRLWVRKWSTHRPCSWPYPLWVPHSMQQAKDTSILRFAPIPLTARTLGKILYFSLLRGTLEKNLFYVSLNAKQHWVPFYTLLELMGIYHFCPKLQRSSNLYTISFLLQETYGKLGRATCQVSSLERIIKTLKTINAGGGVEKREPSYTVGRNVNWYSHCGEQYEDSLTN